MCKCVDVLVSLCVFCCSVNVLVCVGVLVY